MRARIYTYLLIIMIVVALLSQYVTIQKINDLNEITNNTDYNTRILNVELRVYRNGKLIYAKTNDPILDNYFKFVLSYIGRSEDIIRYYVNTEICFVNTNIPYHIGLNPDTLSQYNAFCTNASAEFKDYGNGTVDVYVYGAGSPHESYTIYGVYLFDNLKIIYSSLVQKIFTLAVVYDNFGSAISLSSGDVITVVYRFRFQLGG